HREPELFANLPDPLAHGEGERVRSRASRHLPASCECGTKFVCRDNLSRVILEPTTANGPGGLTRARLRGFPPEARLRSFCGPRPSPVGTSGYPAPTVAGLAHARPSARRGRARSLGSRAIARTRPMSSVES